MWRKKSSLKLFKNYIFCIFLIVMIIFLSPSVFSQRRYMPINKSPEEVITDLDRYNFVEEIYAKYADMNFVFVYQNLHPDIKAELNEVDYLDFQRENFEKYDLKIESIEVMEESSEVSLPERFNKFLSVSDDEKVYKFQVNYTMVFTSMGSQQEEETDNDVFVLADDHNIYLLWDPGIID